MKNRVVDYIELLTMIKDGKIAEGTIIERYEGELNCGNYILLKKHFRLKDGESILEDLNDYKILFNSTFKIISEKIEIDSIEEINEKKFKLPNGVENQISYREQEERAKINELIKAVKQLNRKIED